MCVEGVSETNVRACVLSSTYEGRLNECVPEREEAALGSRNPCVCHVSTWLFPRPETNLPLNCWKGPCAQKSRVSGVLVNEGKQRTGDFQ